MFIDLNMNTLYIMLRPNHRDGTDDCKLLLLDYAKSFIWTVCIIYYILFGEVYCSVLNHNFPTKKRFISVNRSNIHLTFLLS